MYSVAQKIPHFYNLKILDTSCSETINLLGLELRLQRVLMSSDYSLLSNFVFFLVGLLICAYCRKIYKSARNLREHQASGCTGSQIFTCDFRNGCRQQFRKRSELMSHYIEKHNGGGGGDTGFVLVNDLKLPQKRMTNSEKASDDVSDFLKEKKLIGEKKTLYRAYSKVFTAHTMGNSVFSDETLGQMKARLKYELHVNNVITFQLCLPVILFSQVGANRLERHHHFTTSAITVLREGQINSAVDDAVRNIFALEDKMQQEGSGWR